MTTANPAPPTDDFGPRRWTIEEFERLPDDLLAEGERAELIDGLIYTTTGQNDPHYFGLLYALRAVRAAFASGFEGVPQMPTRFANDSKVEPDILVLRGRLEDFEGRRVNSHTDVALLVKIGDSTLARDKKQKTSLYAREGVPEYWIVNLQNRTLEVRRLPRAEGYAETRVFAEDERVPVNGGEVAMADLLPKSTMLG